MKDVGGLILGGLAMLVGLTISLAIFSAGSGVVYESCADLENRTTLDLDSHWTYVFWPPLVFAPLDPPGGCVRTSPGRQALDAVGIWDLPPPDEQVREHIESQLRESSGRPEGGE